MSIEPSTPREPARVFLEAVLAGAPTEGGAYFYLWDHGTKSTSSYPVGDPDSIARATDWSSTPAGLYVGVGLSNGALPARQRLKNDTAAGLLGVFLDIDVAGPAHQKPNLPPSMDAGLDLLEEFGAPPTRLVDSGHGLQPWWFFDAPWIFASEADRQAAAELARGWVTAHRTVAARHGWDHDAVGDLARVLRLPGTINAKIPESPVEVTLLDVEGPRYTAEQLGALIDNVRDQPPPLRLIALPPSPTAGETYSFTVDADAAPPADKLERLLGNRHAEGSWNYNRPDFQDQSPSAFDQSLATLAVRAGWADQEVVDLLIAARRRNGRPAKLRPDYYQRTLEKSRASSDAGGEQDDPEAGPSSMNEVIKQIGVVPALAEVVEDTEHFAQGKDGVVYRYEGGRYVTAEQWVKRETRRILEDRDATKNWGPLVCKQLLDYIGCVAPPLWECPPSDRINVENGLVDITTGTLTPHSPAYRSTVQLPVIFDPDATCPAIDKFVRETFPEDAFDLAFELLALAMVPDRSIQKAVLLVGPGGNGKSVVVRLIQRLIGPENHSTVPLQRLEDERFSASRLDGMLANICADLPASDLRGSSMFKGITGGDRLTVEKKYHDSYDLHPHCKLIFSANNPPRSPDASDAFFQRWIVISFERSFRGEAAEIPSGELDARLHAPQELSGALNRALAARRRIKEHGLSEPLSSLVAREQFRAATDPISVWVDQWTVSTPGAHVTKRRLWEQYNSHAIRAGRPTTTVQSFGRALHRSRPHLQAGQRMLAGKKVEVWLDLTLRQDPAASAEAGEAGESGEFRNSRWPG